MAPTAHEKLARIVRTLLVPVLAFCLRRSLRLREILELVKVTLVELSILDLKRRGEVVSASKIALMTGVHRKDVAELLKSPKPREVESDVVRKIIGQWRSDRRFTMGDGRPRALEHIGKESEFVTLVRSVHSELNPYSILFELERIGAVRAKGDRLQLLSSEYVPSGNSEERFALVARDLDDLLRAAEENIMAPQPVPNLQLSTSYDNVSVAQLAVIRKWFMDQGAQLHERARQFLSQFDRDINPVDDGTPSGARVVIGTFSLAEEPIVSSEQDSKEKIAGGT